MLEVKNIHAAYGKVNVLRGIDLHLEEGEIVAVLGSNGAGKTTLNHNLCGLYCPVEGSVKFSGMDITGWRPEKIVEMGMIQIPEGRRLFPNLSVLENLEMGSYKRGKTSRTQNLERVFEIFPRLKERREQLAGTLSGGEQQMAAIGRSLMAIRLLPMAAICCSPPERVPASCSRRSFNLGKISKTLSRF